MKLLLVFAIVFVVAHAASIEEQWKGFKLKHGRTYKSLLEEKRRFAIFQDKIRQIEEHNARFDKGEVRYSVGINQFTDWTDEEFKAYLLPNKRKPVRKFVGFYNDTSAGLRDSSIDWVEKGAVTPVKNQGRCGSCWAFSTVGAIEGQVAINRGELISLSPQNLVDCSSANQGCNGGWQTEAFKYVEYYGVLTEEEYPYTAQTGDCSTYGGQKISSYVEVDDTEDALLSAVNNVGPVAVCVDAEKLSWYNGGIADRSSGCSNEINHAVLAVGYGSEDGTDYWLIKNSWGEDWGENGYFRLIRGENACGINTENSYPQL